MKTVKKIFSMLLVVVMALAMAITTFADGGETYSITIEAKDSGHKYIAYQVFKGKMSDVTLGGQNQKILSDIEWGDHINAAAQSALRLVIPADYAHTDLSDAQWNELGDAAKLAHYLDTLNDNSSEIKAFAEVVGAKVTGTPIAATNDGISLAHAFNNLTPGYYLIMDDKDNFPAGVDHTHTQFILSVTHNAKVDIKTGKPTIEKKVKDKNDTDGTETDWQDSADYDIGDTVPFQITVKLPENLSEYHRYKLQIVDTLSNGLSFYAGATSNVKLMYGTTDVTSKFTIPTTDVLNGGTLNFTCDNILDATNGFITAGDTTANSKTIVLTYNVQLNANATIGSAGNPNIAKLVFSNDPNFNGTPADEPTTSTPDDKVIVFTYKVDVKKFNSAGGDLSGAGFTLYKKYNTTPSGGVAHETETGYYKVGNEIKNTTGNAFEFKGIDDGDYMLVETTVPEGYNRMTPIKFSVTATHDENSANPTLTALVAKVNNGETSLYNTALDEGKISTDLTTGNIPMNIQNRSGQKLPTTGGVGTTLFYVFGSILVIVAGVLLVTKKRMASK